MRIREITDRNLLADSAVIKPTAKPMTPDQMQVKALTDRSKQLKNQAAQIRASKQAQRAQQKLAKANQALSEN